MFGVDCKHAKSQKGGAKHMAVINSEHVGGVYPPCSLLLECSLLESRFHDW